MAFMGQVLLRYGSFWVRGVAFAVDMGAIVLLAGAKWRASFPQEPQGWGYVDLR